MKNFNFAPFTRFAPLALVTALLFTACTPMDHTNPYDPASSLTAPNRVDFNISNNVIDIGPSSVTLTWNRNTEADFAFYLILRDSTDPGVPSSISTELQTELAKTNTKILGPLDNSNSLAQVFPKTTSALHAIALVADANTTTFFDTNCRKRTEYHYRILSMSKNLKTFAISSNLRLETPPDDGLNAFYPVYSPFMLDINRTLIDVDFDPTFNYLYISGTANGLLKAHGIITNFTQTEYFLAKAPLSDGQIDLEDPENILLLSGNPGNTNSPTRFRGFAVTNNTAYLGSIRGASGLYETGGLIVITNAALITNAFTSNGLGVLFTNISSQDIRFGDWGSLLTINNGKIYYFRNAVGVGLTEVAYDAISATELATPTKPQLVNGIAFDDNNKVYVSSLMDGTVRKYDFATGDVLWTRGGAGTKPGQFQEIGDVAYFKDGTRERIYVTDPVNNRITVYNEDGDLLSWVDTVKVFGRQGYQPRGLKVVGSEMLMTVEIGIMRFSL